MTEDKNSICCSWYESCIYYMQCEHLYNENKDLSEDVLRLEQENEMLKQENRILYKELREIRDRLTEVLDYENDRRNNN